MTFMMGLPGAGKSTVRERDYAEALVLDADSIKEALPGYTHERAPELHTASMVEYERRFLRLVAEPTEGDTHVVIDGTGTNAEALVRRMQQAKAMGWTVEVCYVRVALATALARAAQRARVVPADVIRDKALNMETAFALVAPFADRVRVVAND